MRLSDNQIAASCLYSFAKDGVRLKTGEKSKAKSDNIKL